ncbi:MAG: hypothetical protein CMO05_01480 [Thalassospira sp.]|uniref:hypothetical protein n=1 Tax=Thalassospira sp. GB04J01 TaxID=1485225 RepID=UPI000C0F0D6E|nr:hypothetical protein [Thalassospira sp. GB04J01]MBV16129.1 hypothetical protein [Thalassospira sp.]|tara:strand:- start:97616 stop:98860 length:1245 start_codon:yes stop_codon:yes gene_type:complete
MHAANEPVPLGKTEIEFTQNGILVRGEAHVYLRLLPKPCLIIECDVPTLTDFQVGHNTSVLLIDNAINLRVILLQEKGKNGQSKLFFTPAREPCTVLEKADEQLETVTFQILNFVKFHGNQRQKIEFDGWVIRISPTPGFSEIEKTLKARGGYAVTHQGKLRQLNGNTFPIEDAQHILEKLQLYLSFIRGAYCSPISPVGTNRHGEEVWKQWGTRTVEPWGWTPSFFDTVPSIPLSEIFPGFWSALDKDPDRKNAVQIALQWYLRSNRNNGDVHGGLFLSQSALERLADLYKFNKPSRSDKNIRDFLRTLKIDTEIPSPLKRLQSLVCKHPNPYDASDGPYVITRVRNNLIHPDHKWGNLAGDFEYQAWNLAQWYVELALLAIFRFNGQYGNRLIPARPVYMVESVPWAAEQKD